MHERRLNFRRQRATTFLRKEVLRISRYRDTIQAKEMVELPEIARFYGIVVKMYLVGREHNPPHVHFIYGERMASYDVQSLQMLEGDLPPKAEALCFEWLTIHKDELLEMWNTQVFRKLPPLE